MLLNKEKKEFYLLKIKKLMDKSLSILLINFYKLSSNNINKLRKEAYKNGSKIKVIHNNLMKIIIINSKYECLSKYLFNSIMLIFSIKHINSGFILLKKFNKNLNNKIKLKCIFIKDRLISLNLYDKLSTLKDEKEALSYLIFYLKSKTLFRLLFVLSLIRNIKI